MRNRLRWAILVLLALAAPLASSASAMTVTTVSSGNQRQIQAQFTFNDTVTCDAGTFPVQTFVSILSFENVFRSGGQTTTTLTTNLFVGGFSPCGGSFEFKSFDNVGTLSMNALDSASLTGHFVFDDGTFMNLNLTFTGTSTTQQGNFMSRTMLPHFMTMNRSNGSTRDATMGGTINSNGHVVSASTFSDTDAMLSRQVSAGQITVMRF
jgi:hypothetical protein